MESERRQQNSGGSEVALSRLAVGDRATILRIASRRFSSRLMALGFVPGSSVVVRRKSPLRDPTEYEVRGTRVCLRASEAAHIIVSPEGE